MGKNEAKQGIKWIKNFVEMNKHTNILLIEVPHRHDLIQYSCVNKEVEKYNSKMKKHTKAHDNTEVIKVNLDRGAFTKHGHHMNTMGKELMAKRITEAIKHTLKECKKTPIVTKWKEGTSKTHGRLHLELGKKGIVTNTGKIVLKQKRMTINNEKQRQWEQSPQEIDGYR